MGAGRVENFAQSPTAALISLGFLMATGRKALGRHGGSGGETFRVRLARSLFLSLSSEGIKCLNR